MIITETIKKNNTWKIDVFKQKNRWTYWTYKNALIKEITNIFNISDHLSLNTNDYINIKNLLKNAKFKFLENVAEYEKSHEIRILKFIQDFLNPNPDTIIRVFMAFKPSNEYVEISAPKETETPQRNGFTLVEWGGSILK